MNHPYALHSTLKRPLPDALATRLRAHFGERFSTAQAVRDHHGRDESPFPVTPPDAVVFAESTEDVVEAVNACREHRFPIIAYGAGSSLEGHLLAVQGGLTIDLSRMNRMVAVHAEDLNCTVQAGVTRKQLNAEIKDTGLFFPIDPGADASLGGMSATRASGTNAVRYGTMRENVLALTVVTAQGKVIRTGGRAKKSSAGYDLTRLFIGSEGTLGIITEIQLRLHGIPEASSAAVCQFPDLGSAVETVIAVMQAGIPVARIELLDDVQMGACIAYSKLEGVSPAPTLFFEFHGTAAGVKEQAEQAEEIAGSFGAAGFQWATDPAERARLWRARHDAYWACLALKPGYQGIATDAIVPISRLAECILGAQEDIRASGLTAPIVGHVGDGNFHTVILVPPEPGGLDRAWELDKKIVARALALGGSCSGEHGVGIGKREFLEAEVGAEALAVMRGVKASLDPKGILNPGKIFLN